MSKLDSISFEEICETLEPTLIKLVDKEFTKDSKAALNVSLLNDVVKVFRIHVENLEGTSDLHSKLMALFYEHIIHLNFDSLCDIVYSLAYRKTYFTGTNTKEEREIEGKLIYESNVQIIKYLFKTDSSKQINKADLLQLVKRVASPVQMHELEWAFSVLNN